MIRVARDACKILYLMRMDTITNRVAALVRRYRITLSSLRVKILTVNVMVRLIKIRRMSAIIIL